MKKGRWEPRTLQILSDYLTPTSVFYDIGAWIGPTVLYAAPRCRSVYCFEPDYVAYQYLLWNLRLNRLQNVLPFNIALSIQDGIEGMSSFGDEAGDSQSSLLNPHENYGMEVLCLTFNTWLDMVKPDKADFIKMDIEGAEFDLLPAMADYIERYKPVIYLSTHAHLLPEPEKKEKMQNLASLAEKFDRCLNENLVPVSVEELWSESALQRPRTFLWCD